MANTITSVVATINGQAITLTYNSQTGKYEGQSTAPAASSYNLSGGYYPVSITAAYATGNSTTVDNNTTGAIGTACRLVSKERVLPTIAINSPSDDSYITTALQHISLSLRDNATQTSGYSGINLSTLSCRIHNAAQSADSDIVLGATDFAAVAATGGYDCTYTPASNLPDGSYTITVNVSDNDGNAATTTSVSFVIDTIAPDLTITSPAVGLQTSNSAVTVTGITTDTTSAPVTVAITLNGTDTGTVTVGADGAFSEVLTLTQTGDNVIVITATDTAGRATTITRTVYYSTALPVFTSVTITPNPVDGGTTYLIAVEVS